MVSPPKKLGRVTLSSNDGDGDGDGDGYENLTYKVKSRCFKLYSAYSISFNLSNVGSFLELNSKILYRSSGKEKESRCLVFTFSTKREIKAFSHRSRAVTARKCTKKRDARAKMLFCQSKPTAFLPFLLTSPSSLLKLPKIKMIGTLLSVVHRQVHNNK